MELRGDGVYVVDAATPDAAAGLDERGPEAGVVGEFGMRCEVRPPGAFGEKLSGNIGGHCAACGADKVDSAVEIFSVDDDLDLIAVLQFA